jgi:hypothetical protein
MQRLAILFLCAAIAAPSAGFAAGQSAGEAVRASDTPKPINAKSRKDRLVCKTQEQKGSRLGGQRVCRTQAEWDDIAANQRQELERRLSLGPARQ